MKVHPFSDLKTRAKLTDAEWQAIRDQAQTELLEDDLRGLRAANGVTQMQLAEAIGTSQSELSRLERRGDWKLSTLRKVVHALGGELDIVIRIGDRQVRLQPR